MELWRLFRDNCDIVLQAMYIKALNDPEGYEDFDSVQDVFEGVISLAYKYTRTICGMEDTSDNFRRIILDNLLVFANYHEDVKSTWWYKNCTKKEFRSSLMEMVENC